MAVNGEKHSTEVTLEVCGLERTVEVDFTIYSFGSPDSFNEPGDPPEFEIDDITDLSGPGQYDKYNSLRDQSLKTILTYPDRKVSFDSEGCHIDLGEPKRVLAYGYGFGFDWRGGPFTFNKGRTLIDVIYEDILNRINDFDCFYDD